MKITDLLAQAGGIESMARELGISEAQAAQGAAALAPAILGGFKRQVQSESVGLGGLGGLLGQLGGGGLLDQVLSPQATDTSLGDGVLGQIFGSREVSRTVAKDASARSGLDPGLLKKMLPLLAMMIAGYMAKRGGAHAPAPRPSSDGGLGDLLGGLLGGGAGGGAASSGDSLSGFASMLDLDGDGNPLDDILGMANKAMR